MLMTVCHSGPRCTADAILRHVDSLVNVADLKQCLIAAWSSLQQHASDEATDQWRGQLRACVRADG